MGPPAIIYDAAFHPVHMPYGIRGQNLFRGSNAADTSRELHHHDTVRVLAEMFRSWLIMITVIPISLAMSLKRSVTCS